MEGAERRRVLWLCMFVGSAVDTADSEERTFAVDAGTCKEVYATAFVVHKEIRGINFNSFLESASGSTSVSKVLLSLQIKNQ